MSTAPLRIPALLALATALAFNAPLALAGDAASDFANDCAACHGATGQGDGPVAKALKTPPRDLTRLSQDGAFPHDRVYRTIDGRDVLPAHGSRDMPVWGENYKPSLGALGEEKLHARIEALVKYIEGLQRP